MLPDFLDIVHASERLLSAQCRESIQITDVQQISEPERRNLLLRLTLAPNTSLPTHLIVKQVVATLYNPDALESWDTQRFYCDWLGAQFLSELPNNPNHGPRFFGGHRVQGFIILEDLGSNHQSLVEPLLEGDASTATAVLIQFAQRLGQMHADTLGMDNEFTKLRQELDPEMAFPSTSSVFGQLPITKILENLTILGCEVEQNCQEEIRRINQIVANPGPFTAYIHQDACPDNFVLHESGLRIIDFECGGMGHALIDILYARIPFPSCWCCNRIPSDLVRKMEEAYRTALSKTCVAARDEGRFYKELTMLCGYLMLHMFQFDVENLLEEDEAWGIATIRSRVLSRLDAFVEASNEFGHLPALQMLATQLTGRLRAQWPESEPLPLYPVFCR
ncbi:MAG: phosphotransferase [Chloroflexota bacterium]